MAEPRPRLMLLPILDAEDGYGVSYGARLALPNPLGTNSRLSMPFAWGGQKQAALERVQTGKDRQKAFVDIAWALINTREFILNH